MRIAERLSACIDERALSLGVDPEALRAKGQGCRKDAKLKLARHQIVLELREIGMKQADIGRLLGGRSKESIHAIEHQETDA